MTPYAAAEITKARLRLWQRRNEREGTACTPVVLVNVCHGEQAGQIVVNLTEDVPLDQLAACLRFALEQVEQKVKQGN